MLFVGTEYCRAVTHNTYSLVNKHFLRVGQLFSTSIVQGGSGPASLTNWMYTYFCNGIDGDYTITDFPDGLCLSLMQKVRLSDIIFTI